MARPALFAAYALKAQELAELHETLSFLRSQEREAKLTYLEMDPSLSIRDREKMADKNALQLTGEVFKAEGQIKALEIECEFIKELLK